MAIFKADQNQTGFFYESGTYGNISGGLHWVGQVMSCTPDEERTTIRNRYQGTGTRNVDQFLFGVRDYTGTLVYNPQDWKFLMFALGSNVDAGSPSPYSHTISETNSDNGNAFTSGTRLPFMSFGLEIAQQSAGTGQNFIRTAKGCNVNSMTISATQGEKVEVSVDWVAQTIDYSSGAATSISEDTTRPYLWDDISVQFPSGTAISNLTQMEFTINNNANAQHFINGSKVIDAPTMDNREYTLSLSVEGNTEQTKTLYDQYYIGGSEFNALMDFTVSAGSKEVFVALSGCRVVDMEAPHEIEGTDIQTITIEPKSASAIANDIIELYNPW
jgi:hypothetical protein